MDLYQTTDSYLSVKQSALPMIFLQQILELRIALLIRARDAPRQGERDDQREQHRAGVPHGATSAI